MDNTNTPKQLFLAMQIIHFALIVGQLLFAGIFIFLVNNNYSSALNEYDNVFLLLAIVITFGALYGANFIYKLKLKAILPDKPVQDKLVDYRTALISASKKTP
jgi:uncharacterized integral membrane protein